MRILGISCFYHDAAACLVEDGRIVAAVQEERFTRVKHDSSFPRHAIRACLHEARIDLSGVDSVVFYEKPFVKFERLLETYLATAPFGLRSYLQAMPVWLRKKFWTEHVIRTALNWHGEVLFSKHHVSHASSAFFPSPFERAAILTIDGVGEWATTAWGIGKGNSIDMEEEIRFPHSLGLLYAAFTSYLGFEINDGEGKVMGLAPYGRPRFSKRILDNLLDLKDDGTFRLDVSYFDFLSGLRMTNTKFHALFDGDPRVAESEITERHKDIAASVQEVTGEIVLRLARDIRKRSREQNLCLAGGVALNCVANGRLARAGIFERMWVQPAAGDAGGALGAALAAWHEHYGRPRLVDGARDSQRGSLLGPAFSPDEIMRFLSSVGAEYRTYDEDELNMHVARLVDKGGIVGVLRGRMEFGPRALGARSIVADPRDARMQERLNRVIKFREDFRPFAPAVLAEQAAAYFDMHGASPYMTSTVTVLEAARSQIPAVTHKDSSARVQIVDATENPQFHALLMAFYQRTGCPVLINTSLNVRGEPIACSPEDAYHCFMHTGMDALVLENVLVVKSATDYAG